MFPAMSYSWVEEISPEILVRTVFNTWNVFLIIEFPEG